MQISTLVIVMNKLRVEPTDLTIPDIADEIDRIELILEMMEVDET